MAGLRQDGEARGRLRPLEEEAWLQAVVVLVADHDQEGRRHRAEFVHHVVERGAPHLHAAHGVGRPPAVMSCEAIGEELPAAQVLVLGLYTRGALGIDLGECRCALRLSIGRDLLRDPREVVLVRLLGAVAGAGGGEQAHAAGVAQAGMQAISGSTTRSRPRAATGSCRTSCGASCEDGTISPGHHLPAWPHAAIVARARRGSRGDPAHRRGRRRRADGAPCLAPVGGHRRLPKPRQVVGSRGPVRGRALGGTTDPSYRSARAGRPSRRTSLRRACTRAIDLVFTDRARHGRHRRPMRDRQRHLWKEAAAPRTRRRTILGTARTCRGPSTGRCRIRRCARAP